MILLTDIDDAYLIPPTACSRISGQYYFTNRVLDYYKGTSTPNSTILTELNILRSVGYSSAEAETCGTLENEKM